MIGWEDAQGALELIEWNATPGRVANVATVPAAGLIRRHLWIRSVDRGKLGFGEGGGDVTKDERCVVLIGFWNGEHLVDLVRRAEAVLAGVSDSCR